MDYIEEIIHGSWKITYVEIVELWGWMNRSVDIHNDINFFIGPNGTGKTSIISLVAGLLQGDYTSIKDTWFNRFNLMMQSNSNQTISFKVERKSDQRFGVFESALIKIFFGGEEEPVVTDRISSRPDNFSFYQYSFQASSEMEKILERLPKLTWLSLFRAQKKNADASPFSNVNPIDRHISDIENRFRAYMNSQKTKIEAARTDFDRNVFLSLLNERKGLDIYKSTLNISVEEQKEITFNLFSQMGISNSSTDEVIDRFFSSLSGSLDRSRSLLGNGEPINTDDYTIMTSVAQLSDVTQHWLNHARKVTEIRSSEIKLTTYLDQLFEGKRSYISPTGNIVFFSRRRIANGQIQLINASELSSGEKQMLILLVEAVLQENEVSIYLADEPELSLHVTWQEKVVDAIIDLNPNAQIVFATHSPDILASYQDKAHDFGDAQ